MIFRIFLQECLLGIIRIIFSQKERYKIDIFASKMKMKNLPKSENYVSDKKLYHTENPQALLNPNIHMVLHFEHRSAQNTCKTIPCWPKICSTETPLDGGNDNTRSRR